jgi:hypothetical protein
MSGKPAEWGGRVLSALGLILAVGLGTHLAAGWLAPLLPMLFAFVVLGAIFMLVLRRR